MQIPSINVLFVSCENAVRSILAEACLNHLGNGRLRGFSCGVPGHTVGTVSETVLGVLKAAGMPTENLSSKPWDSFTRNGAPRMQFVIALDEGSVARHPCWPGQPVTAVWHYPAILGPGGDSADIQPVALQTLYSLRRRLELLVALSQHGTSSTDLRSDIRDMAHIR